MNLFSAIRSKNFMSHTIDDLAAINWPKGQCNHCKVNTIIIFQDGKSETKKILELQPTLRPSSQSPIPNTLSSILQTTLVVLQEPPDRAFCLQKFEIVHCCGPVL